MGPVVQTYGIQFERFEPLQAVRSNENMLLVVGGQM